MHFSKDEKDKIKEAVANAEKKTCGEIVPMIIKRSDNYPASHFRMAILLSAFLTCLLYALPFEFDPFYYIVAQAIGLVIGYFLGFKSFFKRIFTPSSKMKEEVHQRAIEAFVNNNLMATKERTGVLIMISMLERRVEILADEGINVRVEAKSWSKIAKRLISHIKRNEVTEGLITAITECGELLEEHFPRKEDDKNELKDELVLD